MTSLTKKRIENVFKGSLENVCMGKAPNVTREMLKRGYSWSSSRIQKVTRTKTWEELKARYLNDDRALKTLWNLSNKDNEDKDNRLKASIEILKLNNRYPKEQIDLSLRAKRDEIVTKTEVE